MDDEPTEHLVEETNLKENRTEAIVDDINLMENQTEAIVDENQDEQSDGMGESMSADMLKAILKQEMISDEDRSRILLYSKKKKNRKNRILIRCINN